MRIIPRLLLCFLFSAASLAAQTGPVDSTPIAHLAPDSTGLAWGIGGGSSPGLYRWGGDKWKFVAVDDAPGNPVALAAGPEGAVYCLWSTNAGAHTVTWHQGTSTKTLAHFTMRHSISPLSSWPIAALRVGSKYRNFKSSSFLSRNTA